MPDSSERERAQLLEIARLYAALIRVVGTVDDPALKSELADLIWPRHTPEEAHMPDHIVAPDPKPDDPSPVVTPADWAKDTFERALSTFVLFGVTLLAAGGAIDLSFAHQLATAGMAAVLVVVTNALPGLNFSSSIPFFDVLQRAAKSSVQAAGAIIVAAGSGWLDVSVWQGAGLAAVAAAASVIKGYLATKMHPAETITPASLVRPAT